jgi:hypothetical protein
MIEQKAPFDLGDLARRASKYMKFMYFQVVLGWIDQHA